ncbi:MAG TPA: ABC transporter substrate-binding protein [Bradyrhizobium sp.]|jgi:putative ABC transport system substrate-binding protein|nr:ABC transporter substrate-binding protein [Bradyrhizobium sp.]
MRRREFILGVGEVSILAALPVARAQEAGRRYRIAILTNTPREVGLPPAFRAELGHGGFVEGGNLDVDYRGFGVAPSSLEAVAIELTRARPDVIFATGPEAARATQRATTSIAIVALANDLVTSGLVASMPHPEGNTTGVAIFAFQLDVKRLELLHEALPEARRIGILAEQVPIIGALNAAARDFGIEISHFTARSQEEIIHAIDAMRATAVDAVNVLASPILSPFVSLIIDRLRLSRLPGMLQWPEGAEAGGLIAYGPRLDEAFRQCARQVAKLLRGAKVADVPVEQPTRFELVINARTARTLGITIPPTLLARADQVIE